MDIRANQEFGQLMFDLIRDRTVAAGFMVPPCRVSKLGDFLEATTRQMGFHSLGTWISTGHSLADFGGQPGWLVRATISDPANQVYAQTLMAMCWASLVEAGNAKRFGKSLGHIHNWFKERGYQELGDEEAIGILAQFKVFNLRQQQPQTLGAAGDALFTTMTRHLSGTSVGRKHQAGQRRRTFLRKARELCLNIEVSCSLADRKALASQLGEVLGAELRASGSRHAQEETNQFWDAFHLLFDLGERLGT